ncbi:MAG: signal recognition particle protein, partial [Oscillospiraceae bacterium]
VGEQAGAEVFELGTEKPTRIVKKALSHAKDYGFDIVIIDTAGRLQIDEKLMDELKEIKEAAGVDETLLVVDSMTGQEAVNVAAAFNKQIGIDGVVLTKLDGDTRGGAALSVLSVTGKPIKFAGTGEKIDDLEVFHPERMASRILGMGDMMSLIESAEKSYDAEKAIKMAKKLKTKKGFDMVDLLEQLDQLRNMGGMQKLLSMIPGGSKIPEEALDESAFKRTEAMILSMTVKEREKPDIINPQRKRRIAAGSGTRVEDVNKLLKQFDNMNKMMKQMTKKGKRRGAMGAMGGMGGMPF